MGVFGGTDKCWLLWWKTGSVITGRGVSLLKFIEAGFKWVAGYSTGVIVVWT